MAMSHANCTHPRTPAGRAACRKGGGPGPSPDAVEGKINGMRVIVEPRRGRKPIKREAKPFSIKDEGDMAAQVPHVFSAIIRLAWAEDYDVRTAIPYNDHERRVNISSERGVLTLVWKTSNPHGVWGAFWRPAGTSITSRVTDAPVLSAGWVLVNGDAA